MAPTRLTTAAAAIALVAACGPDASKAEIWAADFDQTCEVDADCIVVEE